MTDNHPANFEIEVNRPDLMRYYRREQRVLLRMALLGGGGLLGLFCLIEPLMNHFPLEPGLLRGSVMFVIAVGTGAGIGWLLTPLLYRLTVHRQVQEQVDHFRLTVEGAFLCIRTGGQTTTDRKLHFRSIVDYSVVETRQLRRFGLQSLQLHTTAGGPRSNVDLPGVIDCLKVRDLLAEIDALRE